MWHEARRREKATQKLLNEHKKRAEKRREENRIDPNSFLQVNGIKAKLCLDPNVYKQAANSLVAWQGNKSIMIDRFDVRATLTTIPTDSLAKQGSEKPKVSTVLDNEESEPVKKLLNYERYRLLVQNDLNKVPEELRLKLVSKSELASSDAKLRKLRFNKFGTSGDASISQANQSSKVTQSRETTVRRGVAIGFSYNSVPPPSSLVDEDRDLSRSFSRNEEFPVENPRVGASEILDLDDFPESGDLDSVNIPQFEGKRINEITNRYGLTNEEFELILKKDSQEMVVGDLLKELRKLLNRIRNNNLQSSSGLASKKDLVYGPTLPPEMMNTNLPKNGYTDSPSGSSSCDDSPVRQRSPNGATIPLREDAEKNPKKERLKESTNFKEKHFDATDSKSLVLDQLDEPESSSLSRKTKLTCTTLSDRLDEACYSRNSPSPSPSSAPSHSDGDSEKTSRARRNDRSRSRRKRDHQQVEPRRASTPLAYKRNRRSSRSLSRERRSNKGSSYSRTRRRENQHLK